jgi:hypothetical protein
MRWPGPNGPLIVTFRSRYIDVAPGLAVPTSFVAEVRGAARSGQSIKSVGNVFAGAAHFPLPILALSANAAIAEPDLALVYDNTPGETEHGFLQCRTYPEHGITERVYRTLDVDATGQLLERCLSHAENKRLYRAATHYRYALDWWRGGHELLSLEHLYIGMETLVEVARQCHPMFSGVTNDTDRLERLGVSTDDVHKSIRERMWCGCENVFAKMKRGVVADHLKTKVLSDVLFHQDIETFEAARSARHGFQHGFDGLRKLRRKASIVRDKTAMYLRRSMIELVQLDAQSKGRLLDDEYSRPIGPSPAAQYLIGSFRGDADHLAADRMEHPHFIWDNEVTTNIDRAAEPSADIGDVLTPVLGDGVTYHIDRIERYDSGGTLPVDVD